MSSSAIKISTLIFVAAGLFFGCTGTPTSDASGSTLSHSEVIKRCSAQWGGIYNEWRSKLGEMPGSIKEVRQRIDTDEETQLARIIKQSWRVQKHREISFDEEEFGYWPITSSELRDGIPFAFMTAEPEVDAECLVADWLFEAVRLDLTGRDGEIRKFEETPPNMNWISPYAQRWVVFWMLANVHSSD